MKQYNQQIRELREYYVAKLPDKINALELTWQEFLKDHDLATLQVLYRQTHNMSSSAGTYGYKEISEIVKKIDRLLRDQANLTLEKQLQVNRLIEQLKKSVKKISRL